jgi:tRNA(adenine34) deaminase
MHIDETFMRLALREASKAADRGEIPVGAVLIDGSGAVISRGGNATISKIDPTAHAEVVAIRKAARKVGNHRLTGAALYVTVEPCAMCLGALIQARIGRLVYGANDSKAGAVRSIVRFPVEKTNHRLEIVSGVMAQECAGLLKAFFAGKRRRRL